MSAKDRLLRNHITINQETADALSQAPDGRFTVRVKPPSNDDVPETVYRFVKGITEYQTTWFGLQNKSPVSVYEIRRSSPERLQLQFSVPTKRLERKVRTQLAETVPGVGFESGEAGLPIEKGNSIGGGVLTMGKTDWYPLRTDFESPPINSVVSSLHRHAMRDSRLVIQVLFQPAARKSIRDRRWARKAQKEAQYLGGDRSGILLPERNVTAREREQANLIEAKVDGSRFNTGIRILVIGAGDATLSRVKELSGGFNVFENLTTGQFLETHYLRTLRASRIRGFAAAVADQEFRGWMLPFQTSAEELAGLVSIPDREQENLRTAHP
ncbi:hypothetical protein [Salinilacihabitans rarus]|uniref:hypothetical protein n=1 Tax=Salinilacihabitans rarus TaxID=2961596 RepID=UPI0020C8DC1B|nr:hypothetical protein [Salinilacihabitans rarus]